MPAQKYSRLVVIGAHGARSLIVYLDELLDDNIPNGLSAGDHLQHMFLVRANDV